MLESRVDKADYLERICRSSLSHNTSPLFFLFGESRVVKTNRTQQLVPSRCFRGEFSKQMFHKRFIKANVSMLFRQEPARKQFSPSRFNIAGVHEQIRQREMCREDCKANTAEHIIENRLVKADFSNHISQARDTRAQNTIMKANLPDQIVQSRFLRADSSETYLQSFRLWQMCHNIFPFFLLGGP